MIEDLTTKSEMQLLYYVQEIVSRHGSLTPHDRHELTLINNEFVRRDAEKLKSGV